MNCLAIKGVNVIQKLVKDKRITETEAFDLRYINDVLSISLIIFTLISGHLSLTQRNDFNFAIINFPHLILLYQGHHLPRTKLLSKGFLKEGLIFQKRFLFHYYVFQ
jgi:hypothetical protein